MSADGHVPAPIRDLVALMYRADWTALSLAAEVAEFEDFSAYMRMTQPSRPDWMPRTGPCQRGWPGRPADRQRSEPHRDDAGGDEPGVDAEPADEDLGQSGAVREQRLRLLLGPGGRFRTEADSSRGSDSRLPPAGPPCPELLCPAWLPASFELEFAGPAVCAGRPAHRVIGRPRPAGRGRRRGQPARAPAGPLGTADAPRPAPARPAGSTPWSTPSSASCCGANSYTTAMSSADGRSAA
jgi:hypothetical protein